MNLEKERELFLQWHYNTFLLENPDIDISNAQYIYDYSHTHEMVRNIRENNFAVWLASASREGYKMVPVENLETIKIACENVIEVNNIDIYRGLAMSIIDDCEDMIGAVE